MELAKSGLLVGALGDIGLQVADRAGRGNAGLVQYFAERHPGLSVAQASLLTGFWSGTYGLLRPKGSLLEFMGFAGLVDLLYRFQHQNLYPTLKEYYEMNSIGATISYNMTSAALVWGAKDYKLFK